MVDRIRELLNARQLTPTQFADTIGVARPIVSHILSGRNKPSLEVVQKIVDAFPDVSLTWLLKGTGSMVAMEPAIKAVSPAPISSVAKRSSNRAPETAHPAPIIEQAAPAVPTTVVAPVAPASAAIPVAPSPESPTQGAVPPEALISALGATATPALDTKASSQPESAVLASPTPVANNSIPASRFEASLPAPTTTGPVREQNPDAMIPLGAQPFLKVDKAIRRIVIFYQDGTFTDYQPENA